MVTPNETPQFSEPLPQAPTYHQGIVLTIGAVWVGLVGLVLLFNGMSAPSSQLGSSVVNFDLLFGKLINVVAGGSLIMTAVLLEVLSAVRDLRIVSPRRQRR